MKTNFKVGDKVRIRKDLKVGERYGTDKFVEDMECMLGKKATIDSISCYGKGYGIKEFGFNWTPEMFEEARTYKLIFRDNATILLKDGKKYVSKCVDDDTYDREKGLLMCLAKSNGVSYRDLQEMIASADNQADKKNEVKEVERRAKVGEYVKIVNISDSPYNEYKNGDILKIVKVNYNLLHYAYYKDERGKYLNEYEYVVLENYKPYKITLSEFWNSKEPLAIRYENDKQGESIYNTMIYRGFCCKVRCKGISDRFEEGYSYIFNDRGHYCAINQGGALMGRKVYNFDEVDLEN